VSPLQAQKIEKKRLKAKEKAPFAGILLSDAALAKIVTDYEAKIKIAKAETEKVKRDAEAKARAEKVVCDANIESEKVKTEAVRGEMKTRTSIYEKTLKKCDTETPWYKSPWMGFVVGQVVAGGICIGAQRVK
jgi:hypothetical protein